MSFDSIPLPWAKQSQAQGSSVAGGCLYILSLFSFPRNLLSIYANHGLSKQDYPPPRDIQRERAREYRGGSSQVFSRDRDLAARYLDDGKP